jgi:hypothetical protein
MVIFPAEGKSAVHVLNWVSRYDIGAGPVFVAVTLWTRDFLLSFEHGRLWLRNHVFFPAAK